MTYTQAVAFLYGLQTFGMKFGLRGIRTLLHEAGDPHQTFPAIHVAGTNGKGSTASLIASVLTAAGYRTGLYTSPHLVRVNERIRINGRPISPARLVRLIREIEPAVRRHQSTFFEAMTAIAFRFFAEEKVDIAVVETGLGGRLDATNVLHPLVSVITSIDLEHTQILGNTLREIAREKAGIIKPGTPCICGGLPPEAERTIRSVARQRHVRIVNSRRVRWTARDGGLDGFTADFFRGANTLRRVRVSLAGEHQLANAALALRTIEELRAGRRMAIPERAVREGFFRVRELSGLRGRLEVVRRRPLTIIDVAHNPAAMKSLCRSLAAFGLVPACVVFGVMKDKAYRNMVETLSPLTVRAFVVSARTERTRGAADLRAAFRGAGVPADSYRSVAAGVRAAFRHAQGGLPVVITGSHFVVGEALAWLTGRNYLTINQ